MQQSQTRYVTNLKEWELPRFTDLVEELVERLLRQVPQGVKRDALADGAYDWLEPPIRQLAQTAANEAIEYWLKGLADGINGRHPVCAPICHSWEAVGRSTASPWSTLWTTRMERVQSSSGRLCRLRSTSTWIRSRGQIN